MINMMTKNNNKNGIIQLINCWGNFNGGGLLSIIYSVKPQLTKLNSFAKFNFKGV